MKYESDETIAEIEAKLSLKRFFLRTALTVAGGANSSPEATRVAGMEAANLKSEIAALEQKLPSKQAA